MLKKILLGSAASTVMAYGALADDAGRYVFRYSSGVLHIAAADDGSGSESGGSGEADPGDGDLGDEDGEPTEPGEAEEGEPAAQPGDIEFAPTVAFYDWNESGVLDADDYLGISFFGSNNTAMDAHGAAFELRYPMGNGVHTITCAAALIAAENRTWCNELLRVTPQMIPGLGEPSETVDFAGSVALVALNSELFGTDDFAVSTNTISLQLPGFVTPGTVAVSSSSLALIDTDSDGHADAGEALRMSLGVTSTSGLDAVGVGFEVRMPGFAPATCSLATVPGGQVRTCDIDFVLTDVVLASLGEPGDSVSLDAAASLVALDGLTYGFEQFPKASASVSFNLPMPEAIPYLRLTYSGGWTFECRTDWSAEFLADNMEMTMLFWQRGTKTLVIPGMNFSPSQPDWINLRSSWFGLLRADYETMTVPVGAYLTPTGDPRGKIYDLARDGRACSDSVANIVSHGDLATTHYIEIESAEIIERVE